MISRREQRPLDELHSQAILEYVERHYYGNYQTLLPSYEGSSPKSMGQLEAEVVRYFQEKAAERWEVYYRDVLTQARTCLELEGQKAADAANRIVKALIEAKVRVVK